MQYICCCIAAAAAAKAAATVPAVVTLPAGAILCQGMSRDIPDGKHSDDQLMDSMVQLAIELKGDAAPGGAGLVGSYVLAFKAHEAPHEVLQHCTAGEEHDYICKNGTGQKLYTSQT